METFRLIGWIMIIIAVILAVWLKILEKQGVRTVTGEFPNSKFGHVVFVFCMLIGGGLAMYNDPIWVAPYAREGVGVLFASGIIYAAIMFITEKDLPTVDEDPLGIL